jgi:predicted PurR-regulated permease PerM
MITRWLALALVVGVMAYTARSVLAPFVIAAGLAYIVSPLVDELEVRLRLPRLAVVGLLYVVLLTLLGAGIWLLEARLAQETRALRQAGPDLVEGAFTRLLGSQRLDLFGQALDARVLAAWTRDRQNELLGRPGDALQLVQLAIEWLAKLLLTLIALFYFLLDGRRLGSYVQRFIPPERRERAREVAGAIHQVLGRFLRGQLFLIGLMALMNYLVLELVFGLPYALPIAIVSGILEVIPLIGPIVAGAIASVVALVHGGIGSMLGVIAAYVILRQIEDQFVMPIVVGRAVHLHPLVPIFAVLTGGAIAGVLGAVLAVPAAAAVRVTLDYVFPAPGSHVALPDAAQPALPVDTPEARRQEETGRLGPGRTATSSAGRR